jgi:hypothetical protein
MEFHLTLAEIIAFTIMMITVISAWVALRVKIQKLETTSQLKFLELEEKISTSNDDHDKWVEDMRKMVKEFLTDNKEEHRAIMHSVGSMRNTLEIIKIQIAEQKAVREYIEQQKQVE